jgi:hypothetical protein
VTVEGWESRKPCPKFGVVDSGLALRHTGAFAFEVMHGSQRKLSCCCRHSIVDEGEQAKRTESNNICDVTAPGCSI